MASFGVRLREQREQRGITLEEISSTTKIGTRMLLALEQDHFDQLPGGIFNKGFIRAYARCLGMDEEQAVADYLVASGNAPSEKEKDKRSDSESTFELQAEAERRESSLPWGTFAILLLLVALGFAVWGSYSPKARPATRKPVPMPPPASANTSSSSLRTVVPAPGPSAPLSSTSAKPQLSLPAPVAKPLSLHIALHADSWLSVASDGHEIINGSVTAPAERTIHAEKEIVVKAGNVGAIDFEFNGKKLPSQGADGEVKTLTFDAAGFRPSPPPPAQP